jgi:hypothetical protein
MAAEARVKVVLRCSECKERNYFTKKNKKKPAGPASSSRSLLPLQKSTRPQRNEMRLSERMSENG